MTHTEGPWVASVPKKEKHMQARWITGNGFFIAKAYGHDGQPVDGNARLIAAAPELLDALRDLLYAATLPMKERREGWDSARALIKKVAGE